MNDDLISRKAAIEYLMTNMGWCDEDGYQVDDADEKRTHIEDLINGIPTVPAVPLDKLCDVLSSHSLDIFTAEHCCLMSEEFWKNKIIEWMEGLDDK